MSSDDVRAESAEARGGFGRALRSFVLWVFILAIAVAAGFAGGYVLRYQELRAVERQSAEQRAEMAAEMARLERKVLEAENARLKQAVTRADIGANLQQVLDMLPGALAEIEQFARAIQDVDAAESALTEAGVSGPARDTLGGTLDELRARLKTLDLNTRKRIAASAEDLENVMAAEQATTAPAPQAPTADPEADAEAPAAAEPSPAPEAAQPPSPAAPADPTARPPARPPQPPGARPSGGPRATADR